MPSHPSLSAGQRATALVLLWLCGTCLRLTVLAVPPVVPLLHADLHLSETQIGLLSSLPPLLFAVAAVPGAALIARFGIVPALAVGLLLNAGGAAARGAVADAGLLYAATIVMAAGVSIMQPSLPPLVAAWFPERVGFATAVYTNGLLLGEIFPVALTIPLVLPLLDNSWRLNFVIWSLPVFATALLLAVAAPRGNGANRAGAGAARRWWPEWRHPLIWRLGLLLGGVSTMYFASNAFLPDYVTAAGRSDLISSALTALNLGQLPASFAMLGVAGRLLREPRAYVAMGALSLASVIGIMVMPGPWIVVWSGVLGFAGAVTFILVLALPSVLSAPHDVHRTSAGMFTISYGLAMVLSVVCGWLWDLTRIPIAAFVPLAGCGVMIMLLASTVSQARQTSAAD